MIKKILYWLFWVVALAGVGVSVYIVQLVNTLSSEVLIKEPTLFLVDSAREATWPKVVEKLAQEKIIDRDLGILVYAYFRGLNPQPGTYRIQPAMTIEEVIKMIGRGVVSRPEVSITIPEGSDILEIGQILESKLSFSQQDFVKAVDNFPTSEYDFIDDTSLQGYLYPDTYRFFLDSKPEDVIIRMLNNFQKKALPSLETSTGLSAYQVLILASIVEKEVFAATDRPIVAGIFLNRLNQNMKLQSDATINFITRSGRSQSSLEDLATQSPYNTYQNNGLPPGPITNPGVEAIRAVINPSKTDYLFFLTTRDNPPKTIYSRSFAEHLVAKQKYLP